MMTGVDFIYHQEVKIIMIIYIHNTDHRDLHHPQQLSLTNEPDFIVVL